MPTSHPSGWAHADGALSHSRGPSWLREPSDPNELVASLSARTPALAPVLELSSLLVDGLVVRDDVALADGQVVEVLPPFAGG